jgi:hypothetical protein
MSSINNMRHFLLLTKTNIFRCVCKVSASSFLPPFIQTQSYGNCKIIKDNIQKKLFSLKLFTILQIPPSFRRKQKKRLAATWQTKKNI